MSNERKRHRLDIVAEYGTSVEATEALRRALDVLARGGGGSLTLRIEVEPVATDADPDPTPTDDVVLRMTAKQARDYYWAIRETLGYTKGQFGTTHQGYFSPPGWAGVQLTQLARMLMPPDIGERADPDRAAQRAGR